MTHSAQTAEILYIPKKYKIHIKYKDMPVYSSEAYYLSVDDFINQNTEFRVAHIKHRVTLTRSLNETSS